MSASLAFGLETPGDTPFPVERFVTGRVLSFVRSSGIARVLSAHERFSLEQAARLLARNIGFTLADPVRARMIRVLFDLLEECGGLAASGDEEYCLSAPALDDFGVPASESGFRAEGDVEFFETCLAHAPAFLRGAPPMFGFEPEAAAAWDRLLGNDGLTRARAILARLVLPRDGRRCDALVLCYGPGFDLVEIEARAPWVRVTALDFTTAFEETARRRLTAPERVVWSRAASWGGFGASLPFRGESFDLVVFTCADPYIPPAERRFVFRDLFRVLRPGGTLGLLTHSYPDRLRRDVPDEWVRRATYCHDFLESVCRGWHGFSEASVLRELFEASGFLVELVTHNSSVWRLAKPAGSRTVGRW